MSSFVNIAAYKFADLRDLAPLRQELREMAKTRRLRGTILLSPEGINLFVAGHREGIDALLHRIRSIPGLSDLEVKESLSDEQPFNRMLVKIKREIIAFGIPGIEPARYTSPRVTARQLKQWLDEGRPVKLLDTRNNYEVQVGTFENAVAINIDDFRDFPAATRLLPDDWKKQPIVTFCTGGIRCEKAAPYLESAGFREVYQLDGGILKYFEECGSSHYQGECFVFDKRVAVDSALEASKIDQCYACQAILSPEDLQSPRYVTGVSCPYCYRTTDEAKKDLIDERHLAIARVTNPLPGSIPYDNVRPINVPLRFDGVELLDFLDGMKTHLSREDWRRACEEGRVVCRHQKVMPGRIVRAGERILHLVPATREPDVASNIRIIDEDEALIVVEKPAPLPMHPCGRFNRNSLSYILEEVYRPLKPRAAHRLDADTTGVVIFVKTREFAQLVQPQFERGEVSKTYLARVLGHPNQQNFECDAPIGSEPGPDGIRIIDATGSPSLTRFRLLRTFDDGTSVLEVTPLTGRTNQIRVHLWSLGLPILGDPIYLPGNRLGVSKTLAVDESSLCLHAQSVKLRHPLTKEIVCYEAETPDWAN